VQEDFSEGSWRRDCVACPRELIVNGEVEEVINEVSTKHVEGPIVEVC
jgi:hypothetical protein